jgi:hypothetical protein
MREHHERPDSMRYSQLGERAPCTASLSFSLFAVCSIHGSSSSNKRDVSVA